MSGDICAWKAKSGVIATRGESSVEDEADDADDDLCEGGSTSRTSVPRLMRSND